MPKNYILILFFFISDVTFCQTPIDLSYKFKGQSPTVYKLTMIADHFDSSNIDFQKLSNLTEDSSNKMNKLINKNAQTILDKKKNINNYFILKEINHNRFFLACTDTMPARYITPGSLDYSTFIDNKGNNLSFYLSYPLKTLTHIFFSLPGKPVNIGDSWKLGVDMIEVANYTICDSSFKKDIMTVSDISITNGDTLVTINYDYEEYFAGVGMLAKMKVDLKYSGRAVSVNRGLWTRYDCTKEVYSAGIVNSNSKENYKLELVSEYPKKILDKIVIKER